jgi:hypothetical protein
MISQRMADRSSSSCSNSRSVVVHARCNDRSCIIFGIWWLSLDDDDDDCSCSSICRVRKSLMGTIFLLMLRSRCIIIGRFLRGDSGSSFVFSLSVAADLFNDDDDDASSRFFLSSARAVSAASASTSRPSSRHDISIGRGRNRRVHRVVFAAPNVIEPHSSFARLEIYDSWLVSKRGIQRANRIGFALIFFERDLFFVRLPSIRSPPTKNRTKGFQISQRIKHQSIQVASSQEQGHCHHHVAQVFWNFRRGGCIGQCC